MRAEERRTVEILGRYIKGEQVNFEPREVGSDLTLITTIREQSRNDRAAVLERQAPKVARQVSKWLENPELYRLVGKARSHSDYLDKEAPPIDWVIDGVLESNGTAMFYGDSGIGKTFFAMHLATCIGSGSRWFERETDRRKVLYLDGENGDALVHRRSQMLGNRADVTYISFPQIELDSKGLNLLRLLIKEFGVEVVVVDPLVNSMQGDENTVEDVRPQIRGLRNLAESESVAIVLVHHENRSGGYRGSSVLKDLVTLQARLYEDKDKTGDDIHWLWVDPKKQRQSTMHKFPFIWFVEDGKFKTGLIRDGERSFKDVEDLVAACRELKERNGEWPGKTELKRARELHGLSRRDAEAALEQALGNELRVRVGPYNKHFIYAP